MAKVNIDIKDVKQYVGRPIGTSKWLEVTQSRINKFAEATGNFQWIHVDQEQARTQLPSGQTIAHNFLLLSLIPSLFDQIVVFTGLRYGWNKGAENLSFLEPILTGNRVRIQLKLSKLEYFDHKNPTASFNIVMEKEGCKKPVLTVDIKLLLVATERVTLRSILPDQHQAVAL